MFELKVTIVGPEESKWINSKQIENAKELIKKIITVTNGLFPYSKEQYLYDRLIMVSGDCPEGGVDIWAESISCDNDIVVEIITPGINSWYDKIVFDPILGLNYRKEGYRTRNLKMASIGNLGYCIVPYNPKRYCKHCKKYGHPSNGGCWTILKMREMRKEGLIIEV